MAPEIMRKRRHREVMYFTRRLRMVRIMILSLSENVNHIPCQLLLVSLIPLAIMPLKVLML